MNRAFSVFTCIILLLPVTVRADFEGKVVGVSTGDTIQVERYGQPLKVRLKSIKAPGWGDSFGDKARKELADLVQGKKVTVKTTDLGLLGGVSGEVFIKGGGNLNQILVKEGFARWDRNADPKNSALAQLEVEARDGRRGLWKDKDALPIQETASGFDRSSNEDASSGPVQAIKKDKKGRCHLPGSADYEDLEEYQSYKSVRECTESGGRIGITGLGLPLGQIKIVK